ncbi:UNVERIFIED_CONTAM: hypothetical protein PYX00_004815 [Menopon gallinae]|uniref:Uncharacterized protein n=1 Tax=Menopon gallinae TaxID=328185 RepID=A0AAW2I7F6_9NEOP
MEANFVGNAKKRLNRYREKTHRQTIKKKQKKERKPRRILSNYEKAVQGFNLNEPGEAEGNADNGRIIRGPLKVKAAQDGVFLKARRALFMRKEKLNDANEARKNEDIYRIIDIGKGDAPYSKRRKEEIDVLKCLNFMDSTTSNEEEITSTDYNQTMSHIICSENHDNQDEEGTSPGGLFRSRSREMISISSSEVDSEPRKSSQKPRDFESDSEDTLASGNGRQEIRR